MSQPEPAVATRRYDNRGRREQAAETRERIAASGAELLRRSSIRDWRTLTVRAVAAEAGVSERTVYRHFGTEKELRDAIMAHQQQAVGIDLGSLKVDDLADIAARVLRFAAGHARPPEPPLDPTLSETDARRRAALVAAVAEAAPDRSNDEHVRIAAVIDLLWSIDSFERLLTGWELSTDDAIEAVRWAIQLVVAASR